MQQGSEGRWWEMRLEKQQEWSRKGLGAPGEEWDLVLSVMSSQERVLSRAVT